MIDHVYITKATDTVIAHVGKEAITLIDKFIPHLYITLDPTTDLPAIGSHYLNFSNPANSMYFSTFY